MFFKDSFRKFLSARRKFTFVAVPSGDYEAFCWDVSRDEYIRINGEEPRYSEESFFNKGMYRIYPGFELPSLIPNTKKLLNVTIEIERNGEKYVNTITAKPADEEL
jgi:hypothetical protein